VPYNQPHSVVIKLLQELGVTSLVANAGSLPLSDLCKSVSNLGQIVWVVEKTSRHMDWSGTPEEAAGRVAVSVWHDLVQENQSANAELPANEGVEPGNVSQVWLIKQGVLGKVVEFTQKVRFLQTRRRLYLTFTEYRSCDRSTSFCSACSSAVECI